MRNTNGAINEASENLSANIQKRYEYPFTNIPLINIGSKVLDVGNENLEKISIEAKENTVAVKKYTVKSVYGS